MDGEERAQRKQAFIHAIERGCYVKEAAAIAEIDRSTVYDWLKKDPDFSNTLKKAKERKLASLVLTMRTHAESNFNACGWMLERIAPKRWGKKDPALAALAEEVKAKIPDDPEKAIKYLQTLIEGQRAKLNGPGVVKAQA